MSEIEPTMSSFDSCGYDLIDCTTHSIDFGECKFLYIGLDHVRDFQLVLRITTKQGYVCISSILARDFFSLIRHILSTHDNIENDKIIFHQDESKINITCAMIIGEHVHYDIIDHHSQSVTLNGKDLLRLCELEHCVYGTLRARKDDANFVHVIIGHIIRYMMNIVKHPNGLSIDERADIIRNTHDDRLFTNAPVPMEYRRFIEPLKMIAVDILVKKWIWSEEISERQGNQLGYVVARHDVVGHDEVDM